MRSNDRDEVVAAYDALEAAARRCSELCFDALTTPERLALLDRLETVRRRLPALQHGLINQLAEQAVPAELGGTVAHALADRLRISRAEAARRVGEAAELGERTTITGERLQPVLAAAAAAQRGGQLGGEHLRVIRGFLRELPGWVDAPARAQAEHTLAQLCGTFRPEQVKKAAERIAVLINPDGSYSDNDRARRRGLTIGPQGADGMSPIRGQLTPELRAGLDAVLAKWAAPGRCNPDDQTASIDTDPSAAAQQRDYRSGAQRNHDALGAVVRSLLSSGALGSHHGLPVTIIVTTTLQDLQSKTGVAVTGGGTLLPISDVRRLARHAQHYLLLFDDTSGRPLYLGHTQRLAGPDQRIVLHATDRGCSAPGCDVPGYLCEVHHVEDWCADGRTDIDNLTFACGPHHRLLKPGAWRTRKHPDGRTEWIPPPHLDTGQPRTNTYHHPDQLLRTDDEEN
jgi:hypothetical protein